MISCLVDFIGLRGISESPDSGIYVNDMPGITTEQFTSTRSQEIGSISDEWDVLETRAIQSFENDLKSNLKKYYQNYTLVSTEATGYVDGNDVVDHGASVYSGILIDLYNQSENLKVVFNSVKINLPSAQTFNIKIFDANTGVQLHTQSVTGVAGLQTVKILKEYAVYDYNRLFICYDTVEPYKAYPYASPYAVSGSYINTSLLPLHGSLESGETGMMLSYSVKCGIDEFVCNRIELFQESYLYRLAIEFIKTSQYSDKINRYTLLDQETKQRLLEEYTIEYNRLIDSCFKDLKVTDDGTCFICNKSITKKVLIP